MNRKLFALLSVLALASLVLAACGPAPDTDRTPGGGDRSPHRGTRRDRASRSRGEDHRHRLYFLADRLAGSVIETPGGWF